MDFLLLKDDMVDEFWKDWLLLVGVNVVKRVIKYYN